MAEEKENKEHEHEVKTVAIKKSTLWGIGVFVLLGLLVISIFTGGFGFVKTGNVANNGNANTGTATTATATPTIDASVFSDSSLFPALGPSNAKIKVIEFADFQCPYCALASGLPSWTAQFASQYSDLIGAAGKVEQMAQQNQVQFIFVPMSFLGQESVYAAEAGFCALDQGKFWQMHDAIYTASDGPTEDTGKYSKANLTVIAQSISGLNMTQFNNCLNNDKDLAQVNQVTADVQNGVTNFPGTPMFAVNGQYVQSSSTAIQAAINAA